MKMKIYKDRADTSPKALNDHFFGQAWKESWVYIKTVVDVVHEPVLILDKDLCVMAANEPFYRTFQVDKTATEGKLVYELGNGQWNIPALRELLEKILPQQTLFNGFEVTHEFPAIGPKIMLLNARQIHYQKAQESMQFPPIILLAIEDVTGIMNVAESLAGQVNQFDAMYNERTERLEKQLAKLEKDIKKFKTAK